MTPSPFSLEHFAALARLTFSEDEQVLVEQQMRHILDHFQKIAQCPLEDEMVDWSAPSLPTREDLPHTPPDLGFAGAPRHSDGYFKVPRVLDRKTDQ
jgi:aspartyl/glutamyl-tRNA(Asn/Gln) amidotransferase C subunit